MTYFEKIKSYQIKENPIIMGIETSCDETAVAIIKDGREILADEIISSATEHAKFGGVVPEIASRTHTTAILTATKNALSKANMTLNDIDAFAVTYGAGLLGALLVGVSFAKSLAYACNKPLVPVSHIRGHIAASYIADKNLKPPFITLVVSGGHTHLVEVKDYGEYEILGRTRDDASGEAFDKIARAMNLGYPGGPIVDRLAKQGNKNAIDFPRAYLDEGYDFSFSGLKSAVLNYLNAKKMKNEEIVVEDVCASFQEAVVEVLSNKAIKAAKEKGYNTITLAGGVACNSALREKITEMAKEHGIEVKYPPVVLCTDNAAMIGCAGYYNYINGRRDDMSLNAVPGLKIGQR